MESLSWDLGQSLAGSLDPLPLEILVSEKGRDSPTLLVEFTPSDLSYKAPVTQGLELEYLRSPGLPQLLLLGTPSRERRGFVQGQQSILSFILLTSPPTPNFLYTKPASPWIQGPWPMSSGASVFQWPVFRSHVPQMVFLLGPMSSVSRVPAFCHLALSTQPGAPVSRVFPVFTCPGCPLSRPGCGEGEKRPSPTPPPLTLSRGPSLQALGSDGVRVTMESALTARDRVGVQDFVLLENFTSEAAFIENLRRRFRENLIYVRPKWKGGGGAGAADAGLQGGGGSGSGASGRNF